MGELPLNTAIVLAILIIMTSIVAVIAVTARRSMQAKEEELRQSASARGWTFAIAHEHGYRIQRWTGTTDGIAWTAEYLHRGGDKSHQRRNIARWRGTFSPGIGGAIVAMAVPKGKEHFGEGIAAGEGFIAKMAQKAAGFAFDKAIDVYFGEDAGKQVDAGAMHRVDAGQVPGFVVMAVNKDEGSRVLSEGLERALVTASGDQASVFSEPDPPSVLLMPSTLALARMHKYRDVAGLERFIKAGIALTKTFTFGRRSPF